MRKILSDIDGYKLSDMAMEDKLVYRSMLKSFKKLEEWRTWASSVNIALNVLYS
jgi:hypothetical protein